MWTQAPDSPDLCGGGGGFLLRLSITGTTPGTDERRRTHVREARNWLDSTLLRLEKSVKARILKTRLGKNGYVVTE